MQEWGIMSTISLMASLAHHPLLFLFINLFLTYNNGNLVNPSNKFCPSFDCGDGLVVNYPFWHQAQQHEHCGYPDFGISCTSNSPMLHLSNHSYRLKTLNYSENTLTLAYNEVNNTICPVVSHGITLNTTYFLNYTKDDKMIHFFYNCTLYPPSVEYIKCLQYGAKRAYVFVEGAIPEFDWGNYCESRVTVPVVKKGGDDLLVKGFGGVLQEGFKLKWKADSGCESCEGSGGFCGYGDKFSCFCSDGQHSANCYDKGVVLIKFKPNFVAIGALIFGGLIIASTIFYFIQKRKIGIHKQGFDKIPSSGK